MLVELQTKVSAYLTAFKQHAANRVAFAENAQNALKFDGRTPVEFLNDLQADILAHNTDTDNPHNDTAAGLGLRTRSEIDALVSGLGGGNGNTFPIPVTWIPKLTLTYTDWTLQLSSSNNVVFDGVTYTLPPQVVPIDPENHASRTMFLGVALDENTNVTYLYATEMPILDDAVNIYVGQLTTDDMGITAVTTAEVVRLLGRQRISELE